MYEEHNISYALFSRVTFMVPVLLDNNTRSLSTTPHSAFFVLQGQSGKYAGESTGVIRSIAWTR